MCRLLYTTALVLKGRERQGEKKKDDSLSSGNERSRHDRLISSPLHSVNSRYAMASVHRSDFAAYSVEFSPFEPAKVAIACSQYFGIIGNGRQYVVQRAPNGNMIQIRCFETQDGLYDCAWNEMNENQVVSASGDGSLRVRRAASRSVSLTSIDNSVRAACACLCSIVRGCHRRRRFRNLIVSPSSSLPPAACCPACWQPCFLMVDVVFCGGPAAIFA